MSEAVPEALQAKLALLKKVWQRQEGQAENSYPQGAEARLTGAEEAAALRAELETLKTTHAATLERLKASKAPFRQVDTSLKAEKDARARLNERRMTLAFTLHKALAVLGDSYGEENAGPPSGYEAVLALAMQASLSLSQGLLGSREVQ